MTALYAIGEFVDFVEAVPVVVPVPTVWYLVRVHPNHDLMAERQLIRAGICCYVPKEKQVRKGAWNRRLLRDVAIFPGSLFVPDFCADIALLKRYADGIGGLVKCAGEALKIPLKIMADIRDFEARRDPQRRKFHVGQRVRITGGPFGLFEGKIERLDRAYRLSVLIDFLGAIRSIELDEDEVEAG